MDEDKFKDYVKWTRHYFATDPRSQVGFGGNLAAYIAVATSPFPAHDIRQLLTASATNKHAWDALSLIAQKLLRNGEPLPDALATWVADVLGDQHLRPKDKQRPRPRTGGSPDALRNHIIWWAVRALWMKYDLLPTRSVNGLDDCCAEGGSGCDIVGAALAAMNYKPTSYKNIEKVWRNRPWRRPTYSRKTSRVSSAGT